MKERRLILQIQGGTLLPPATALWGDLAKGIDLILLQIENSRIYHTN